MCGQDFAEGDAVVFPNAHEVHEVCEEVRSLADVSVVFSFLPMMGVA